MLTFEPGQTLLLLKTPREAVSFTTPMLEGSELRRRRK
jgi:hypothetical protein